MEIAKSKTRSDSCFLASRRGCRRRWRPADDGSTGKGPRPRHGGAVEATTDQRGLFLSVFLGMNLSRFFRVVSRVSGMARGRMGVMGRLLVMASFVVLGSFTVMAGCVGMMLRSLLVMLGCFFGHGVSLDWKFTV